MIPQLPKGGNQKNVWAVRWNEFLIPDKIKIPDKIPDNGSIRSVWSDIFGSIWVFPKIGGKPPKMDRKFHGKPY